MSFKRLGRSRAPELGDLTTVTAAVSEVIRAVRARTRLRRDQ